MNRTVLITGASRGIGRAVATTFAREGFRLVITCLHSRAALFHLKESLEKQFGVEILASVGDIADYAYVEELFAEIGACYGGVDILVNNAGISYVGLLQDMRTEDWNRLIAVNLTSVFSTCRLAIPYMIRQKSGKIINISSVWGNAGASCEAAYSASKGGVHSLTKALAKELAPSNIQVNAVACGFIDTEMNACFSDEEREALRDEIPAGRFGTPEETAELVLQLSAGNPYLTGQVIALDGGWI